MAPAETDAGAPYTFNHVNDQQPVSWVVFWSAFIMSPLAPSFMFVAFGASCLWAPITQHSLTSQPVTQESAIQALFGDMPAGSMISRVVARLPSALYPDNVDCRDYDKTSYKAWGLRKRAPIDLGNWDSAFSIDRPIQPRIFVRKGIDLYDVLERKCGISALWTSGSGQRAAEAAVDRQLRNR